MNVLQKKPEVVVFAGPNGSGKSTFTELLKPPIDYINADEIKKTLKCSDLEAAQLAERQREEHIAQMSEFCFETVLSTERNIKLLEKAKQRKDTDMSKKRAVVSLGHQALGYTTLEQWDAVKVTAKALADLVEADYQLTITHSNGPQVSMIHKAMTELRRISPDYTPAPMCVCSAMSQGYVGYDIQNALRAELLYRGISKPVSTILTQVTVDPYDEAFYEPNKLIGRYMTKDEADAEVQKGNYVTGNVDQGYRRVVAAPKPIDIVEIEAIKTLADADQVVIACGGGGIPVIEQKRALKGASAVIEKDCIAGKLAADLMVDVLIILTSVEQVYKSFGKPEQEPISRMNLEQARAYIDAGEFGRGDMLPKIEAAITFLEKQPKGSVLITSLESAHEAVRGKTGTVITAV